MADFRYSEYSPYFPGVAAPYALGLAEKGAVRDGLPVGAKPPSPCGVF